jgi:TRAP-type C4-dicarboxylate transport system substrate-binding protein
MTKTEDPGRPKQEDALRPRNRSFACFLLVLLTALFVSLQGAASFAADKPEFLIKFAALAPEGSTWIKTMRALDATLREKSGGRLGLLIYAGGIAGDELDVLRKMRIGQIHCAGFGGLGLTQILPEVRILDLPFLFRNEEETDRVHEALRDHFTQGFEGRGFEFLGWTEAGNVHLFSKKPIRTLEDLAGCKVWTWSGDPIAHKTFEAMGVHPIPLAATDVTTSLSTGMIDTVYGPPLVALALQWHAYTSAMTSLPLAHSTVAVLLTKRFFKKLPDDLAGMVRNEFQHAMGQLTSELRKQTREEIQVLEESGIQIVPMPEGEALNAFYRIHEQVARELTGDLYPETLLEQVYGILQRRP